MYESPADSDLSFGDIFESGFLYDAYLRGDVVNLGKEKAHKSRGEGFSFSTLYAVKQDEDFILAHGRQCESIILSDNCAIDKNVGISRPAKIHGRAMLAAIASASDEQITAEAEKNRYSRFALLPNGEYAGGIVDFERVFSLHLRDAVEAKDRRVVRLSDRLAAEFEVRWTAHLARRGPWAAALQVTAALDELQTKGMNVGDPVEVVRGIVAVVDKLWEFQGAHLDGAGELLDSGTEPRELLSAWIHGLEQIDSVIDDAIHALRSVQDENSSLA